MPNCRVCLEPQYCDCLCQTCCESKDRLRMELADKEIAAKKKIMTDWWQRVMESIKNG